MTKTILFSTITILFSAMLFSGCGEKAGSGAVEKPTDPNRTIVSYAGEVDYSAFTPDSVVSLRALGDDGTPSAPIGAVSTFKERRFIAEKIPLDILDKRGFIVEFRDKELLSRPVWELEKGFNDVGMVTRSSTFVSENIREILKEEDINTLDVAFFIAHFGDMEIEAAKLDRTGEEWKEWGLSFRGLMALWARRPDDFAPGKFPDGIFERNVGSAERKQRFDSALAFLFTIAKDETEEYKKWAPRVFYAAAEMFLAEAGEALEGKDPRPEKIREVTGFMFELRDAVAAKYLAEGEKIPETEYEKIDTQFQAKVMDDLNYDSRRKMRYLIKEMERTLKYDISKGPAENLAAFFDVYNKAVLKSDTLDDKTHAWAPVKGNDLKEYLSNAPDSVSSWVMWMKKGMAAKKKVRAVNTAAEGQAGEEGNKGSAAVSPAPGDASPEKKAPEKESREADEEE